MRKKILFIFAVVFSFLLSFEVEAATITCDYGKYTFKFDTKFYETKEYSRYCFIGESEDGSETCVKALFSSMDFNKKELFKVYDNEIKQYTDAGIRDDFILPSSDNDCPKVIHAKMDFTMPIFSESVDGSDDYFDYGLVSSEFDSSNKISCGNITGIPAKIPELTSYAFTIIQIAIPVILVIMGSIDLFKGITAQKEDEIKKGQQIFIKRLIVAALIFFVVVIVKLLVSAVAKSSSNDIAECIDCFISNDCY